MTSIMFYLARNSLAVTRMMSRANALKTFETIKRSGIGLDDCWTLCRHTDSVNPHVIEQLN